MEDCAVVKSFLASSIKFFTWLGATSGKNLSSIFPNFVSIVALVSVGFLGVRSGAGAANLLTFSQEQAQQSEIQLAFVLALMRKES